MFKLSRKPDSVGLPQRSKITRFRKRGPAAVLDLDGDSFRAVQAAPSGAGARIQRAAVVQFTRPEGKADDPQLFGVALKQALENARIKAKEVIVTIPRGQVVLRPLQVPMAADLKELASVVNFQIARDLPFRIEDAVVDFKVLRELEASEKAEPTREEKSGAEQEATPDAPQRRLELLVGAVRKEIVAFHETAAKAAGLKLTGLAMRSTGFGRALALCGMAETENAIALVALGSEEATIEVVTQNTLVFSRVAAVLLPGKSPHGESSEAAVSSEVFLENLVVEVIRSLHSYDGMMWHKPVNRIYVTGGSGLETKLASLLAAKIGVPAEILDPSALVPSSVEEPAALLAAVGIAHAAFDPSGLPLDFANPKRPPVQKNTRRIKMIAAGAAVLVMIFGLFGIRSHLVAKRMQVRNAAQLQLNDAEKKLPIYRRLKAQTKLVNSWLAEEQNWLDHLAYLSSILPPADQIYVSAINTTPQHIIRISVQAKTGELLAELDKKLRAAGYEIKPLSITPANDKYGYNFRTIVELSVPKKMKPDPAKAKPAPRPADDASLKAAQRKSSTSSDPS